MPSLTYPGFSRLLIGTLLIASCSTSKAVPTEDPQPLEVARSPRAVFVHLVGEKAPNKGFTMRLFGVELEQPGNAERSSERWVHQPLMVQDTAKASDDPELPPRFWWERGE